MITDLLSPEAVQRPFEVYRSLREAGPIVWLPEHRAWFIGTYQAVHAGFRDARLSSDRLTPLETRMAPLRSELLADTFELLRGWMVFHDPPHHERLRGPVRSSFTPRAVEGLRPHVEAVVTSCLDRMEERWRSGDTVDLVAELAFPLPAIVIAELLGVPPADRNDFKQWSNQLAAVVFGASSQTAKAEEAAAGTAKFVEYFSSLIEHYERHPADNLISALIRAREEAQPPLSASELVGACTLLLFGGHETTTNLITNAAVALATHPDERRWLGANPDRIALAVEELHRFDGPSKVMVRVAATTHDRSGVTIEAGHTVFLGLSSANRDPDAFPDPDRLWLARPDAHRHLGFGHGLHFCLGAPLARLEAQVALHRLIERVPEFQLAVPEDELRYGATILGRGLGTLPVGSGR